MGVLALQRHRFSRKARLQAWEARQRPEHMIREPGLLDAGRNFEDLKHG